MEHYTFQKPCTTILEMAQNLIFWQTARGIKYYPHRGETMLISISADDFPVTDLSDVVLTIKHGQQETQLHLEDFNYIISYY